MLAIEEAGGADTLVVTASGRLTAEDYRRFVPAFDERLARASGPLRVLLELRGFRGWELPAFWEELKFDIAHRRAFRRIAVAGDRRWQAWGTWLSRPLFRAEMRYFDRSRMEDARLWLGL
jgi:SpoIIAA-like